MLAIETAVQRDNDRTGDNIDKGDGRGDASDDQILDGTSASAHPGSAALFANGVQEIRSVIVLEAVLGRLTQGA